MSKRGELTIGVTGRRHIVPEALEAVERGARELLRAHVDAFDGPVRVCTGLAVGADSIMARIVLDEKKRRPAGKLRLAAVLPRALESYELDFKTAPDASGLSQRAAFRELLAQCDETVELANAAEDAVDPVAGYVRLGDWLVENSDVLYSFWSGDASTVKRGGTADVTLKKLRRGPVDGSIVYGILTPELLRKKNPDGTKRYVPEPTDGAGRTAELREADDGTVVWLPQGELLC